MKVAILSSIAWRTPPRNYGPWEQVSYDLAEGLTEKDVDVTLFATADSCTSGTLQSVCHRSYGEDHEIDPKVWECMHISHLMERADEFDVIHNNFDFLPLTYSKLIRTPMVTTIHGFSSERIIPVYKKYNQSGAYVAVSNANRHPDLDYIRTVYHGIDPANFTFHDKKENYLLFFGRIHPEKGTHVAIQIARKAGYVIKIAGPVQDNEYFNTLVEPELDGKRVIYLDNAGPALRNELLGKAAALLHPISFDEPFGLSVAEAMMCGTPVIAFARGSMPELIVNGVTGFVVDDIVSAVSATERLHEISFYACRKHALKNFSRRRMANDYLDVYKTILSETKVFA